MKILLSAYACEPNKGSEPGVGWSWAQELAKHHNVWVITRDNNESTILQYLRDNPECQNDNLHFIYVGLSRKLTFWKKGRRGMRLFYMLWQKKAVKVAEEWHKKIGFNFVQHVTFVSYTQPSYMYKLGIPMIWGPVSGGENIPKGIKLHMSLKERIVETIRSFSQSTALWLSSTHRTMKSAQHIFVATEETKARVPSKYQDKTSILPAIGIEKFPDVIKRDRDDHKIKIVMAGRLNYWKAFDIGLQAFIKIAQKYPNAEIHILGEGDRKKNLMEMAGKYLNKQVFFEEPVAHDNIFNFYREYDVFLNTTLRDSGCMTMMEAMSVGLPCIAIATGGPKILLESTPECGILPKDYLDSIAQTAKKLEEMILDSDMRQSIAVRQYEYAKETFAISSKVKKMQDYYSV